MYELAFRVGDRGNSGLDLWRLEHRVAGTTAWEELESGSNTGPQSIPFTATAGTTDEFRVVARDEHGNRTVSPLRQVTVPPK